MIHDLIYKKVGPKRCDWCKIFKFYDMIGARYIPLYGNLIGARYLPWCGNLIGPRCKPLCGDLIGVSKFFQKKKSKRERSLSPWHYRWTQNTNLIVIVALAVKLQGPLLQVYKRVCMKILPLKDREITGLKFCWDFFYYVSSFTRNFCKSAELSPS